MVKKQAKLILIVDDEADTLKLLKLRLKKNGYAVTACQTGAEALAAVKKQTPDLAILDMKLPDMNGDQILMRFREAQSLQKIPVIFSTADASVALKKTTRDHAANAFVIKPYDAQELLKKIYMLLLPPTTKS